MRRAWAVLATLVTMVGMAGAADIPDWLLQQMEAAIPAKATATPEMPRKVLVFTRCGPGGFVHTSIPIAARSIQMMGSKTGAFETVVSDDMSLFEPEKIIAFDAVVMDSTTGNPFAVDPKGLSGTQRTEAKNREVALRKSLLDFVEAGHGLVGIHAATDAFYDWPEYGQMMGGYFAGHPWNEVVTVKLDDPEHLLNAGFGGQSFTIKDEIYQFKDPYSRQNLRVLLSLDVTKTDMTKQGISRKDNDFAVSWIRQWGKGRVFFGSLGHEFGVFCNKAIMRHYLDGIQYAIGDLKADATPSAKLPADAGSAKPALLADGPSPQPSPGVPGEGAGAWRELFNGKDLGGWINTKGWKVEEGVIARVADGSDMWTADRFGDFVLEAEFKTAGNSGIFIRTDKLGDPVQTGIEMQVLDSWDKPKPSRTDCGAIYECVAPSKNVVTQDWNKVRITAKANRIVIEMNGEPIIDMDLDQWTTAHRNPDGSENKFNKPLKEFSRMGHIGLQNHGSAVWYRNIRIQPLGPVVSDPRRTPPQ